MAPSSRRTDRRRERINQVIIPDAGPPRHITYHLHLGPLLPSLVQTDEENFSSAYSLVPILIRVLDTCFLL